VTIAEFGVADPPSAWVAAGFSVDADSVCRVGSVRVRLLGNDGGKGIVGWSLRDAPVDLTDVDGVPTSESTEPPPTPGVHPNGATHIDHAVLMSPNLDRTVAALTAIGVAPRRERDAELGGVAIRQVFFRFGEVIVEVIGTPGVHNDGPSTFWGFTHTVTDIDAAAVLLGDAVGPVKDAVQPGRRITTMRHRALGMSVATALISPHQ